MWMIHVFDFEPGLDSLPREDRNFLGRLTEYVEKI